jgi:hypothetical protein
VTGADEAEDVTGAVVGLDVIGEEVGLRVVGETVGVPVEGASVGTEVSGAGLGFDVIAEPSVAMPSILKVIEEPGPSSAEKSNIRTPVVWSVRLDFKLGLPESESSDFAPPILHRSPASPWLFFDSRSRFPSA